MSDTSPAEVRAFVVDTLTPQLAGLGLGPGEVPDGFDLLDATDSLGLLELISDLEVRFGVELDFEDADPEKLTLLDELCQRVAAAS